MESQFRIHLIAARGNGKSRLAMEITEALVRADVVYHIEEPSNTVHIRSHNTEAPLTDREKELLTNSLAIRMVPYEVVFDN